MISNNIQKIVIKNTDSIIVPKLPHCAQSPDLDGVIELVSITSKKTETEIRDMITSGNVTLTAKIIKDIFKKRYPISRCGDIWCGDFSRRQDSVWGIVNIRYAA